MVSEGDVAFEGDLTGERGNDGVGQDVELCVWGDFL